MTAVSVAALTLYDMVKGLDRGAVIGPIQLFARAADAPGPGNADSGCLPLSVSLLSRGAQGLSYMTC